MYAGIVASLLFDQLIVALMVHFAPERIAHVPRWFSLLGQPWSSLIALVLVLLLSFYGRSFWLGVVLGAALSNLVTFLVYKQAIDYIPLWGGVITNTADILITVGLFLWAVFGMGILQKKKS
jgi:lipoprotein signal peptidase